MKLSTWKRRRRLCVMLALCAALSVFAIPGVSASSAGPVFPENAKETPVLLDGVEVLEGECVRMDGVTYVPLRKFSNLFGECTVTWNQKTSTATVKTDALTLIAHTGN